MGGHIYPSMFLLQTSKTNINFRDLVIFLRKLMKLREDTVFSLPAFITNM